MDPGNPGDQAGCDRLPRTRGDGPAQTPADPRLFRASPHTRGWTLETVRSERRGLGFPAHAGMDPVRPRRTGAGPRLPRTRGDGPRTAAPRDRPGRASPHTRGWTPPRKVKPKPLRGFPAHAGMDPAVRAAADDDDGLPRTRGDGPWPRCRRSGRSRASPHTRGWTQLPRAAGGRGQGFPAHAGMDPRAAARDGQRDRLPRTRGDGPRTRRCWRSPPRASPHTRGWTPAPEPGPGPDGGFPAHAGMDLFREQMQGRSGGLPRTRGDGPWRPSAARCS